MHVNVFEALADATRRSLLERLRTSGPLSVTELAGPMPMSRQAVTKHLDVLEACHLVRIRRRGRERLHELDPHPLKAVDAWLAPYAAEWDRRLERLQEHLAEERRGEARNSHAGGEV